MTRITKESFTVEQFIDISVSSCEKNARAAVRQKFIDKLKPTSGAENEKKALAEDFVESPAGQQAVQAMLQKQKFYRLVSSENACREPEVLKAFEKYRSGLRSENAAEQKKERSRNRRAKKLDRKHQLQGQYIEELHKYRFSADEEKELFERARALLKRYYSDIYKILPAKYINERCGEFVSEQSYAGFMNRMYSESVFSDKRQLDRIAASCEKVRGFSDIVRAFAVEKLLAGSGLPEKKIKSLRVFLNSQPVVPSYDINELVKALKAEFDRKTITELVTSGDGYKKLTARMQETISEARSAHELILREIPENVTELYPEAREMHRHFILHLGPTNSGKTYDSLLACKQAETGIYLAPLRLLAYEICEKFNIEGVPCRMRTGEEEIDVPFATHTSSTVEMLNTNEHYDVAVVDECQLIEDEERGGAWTAAILGLAADEIHLCASPNAEEILTELIDMCGDSWEVVRHERSVPLMLDKRDFEFPFSVEPKDALIAFSKKGVLRYAETLKELGIRSSVIYGDLPYDVRRSEVSRFVKGETQVVVATDAVGMGLNLPVKRIVFLEAFKYDGHRRRFLTPQEIKQIAGRAGRMGMYDVGYFNAAEYKNRISAGMRETDKPVKKARLRIPESIISVDLPLSEILLRWGTIPDDGIFTKNIVEREVLLSRELEKFTDDKYLIYRFVTIPFTETRSELYDFWFELFEREVSGDRRSVYTYTGMLERRGDRLEDHELAYRKCDILYFYSDRFGQKEDLAVVMELKHSISSDIMRILSGKDN